MYVNDPKTAPSMMCMPSDPRPALPLQSLHMFGATFILCFPRTTRVTWSCGNSSSLPRPSWGATILYGTTPDSTLATWPIRCTWTHAPPSPSKGTWCGGATPLLHVLSTCTWCFATTALRTRLRRCVVGAFVMSGI